MILSLRKRGAGGRSAGKNKPENLEGFSLINAEEEIAIPQHFRCPISLDLMKDPVTLSTGITYDRQSIETWLEAGNRTCPVTKQDLELDLDSSSLDLIPNHAIRKMIQAWCVENRSSGIDRIPTPRIPVTPFQVSETCQKILAATQRRDAGRCHDLLSKMESWARDSERDKRCILQHCGGGAARILLASLDSFGSVSVEKYEGLLGQILSALTWMLPRSRTGLRSGDSECISESSLRSLLWFLQNSRDLRARQNAVLVLKELLLLLLLVVSEETQSTTTTTPQRGSVFGQVEGIPEALFSIIREPISPSATRASLVTIFHLISLSGMKAASRFVDLGLVPHLIHLLLDADKSVCEKAICVLDLLCDSRRGREMASANALLLPLLVKKTLRVSNLFTEYSISIMWKLIQVEADGSVSEALQVGAFEKLLLLLQVDCGDITKDKVKQLLKLMNLHRQKLGCADSSFHFKYLKKSSR